LQFPSGSSSSAKEAPSKAKTNQAQAEEASERRCGKLNPRPLHCPLGDVSRPARIVSDNGIKEGKLAVKMTRLSCHRFRRNEVRLC